MNERSDLIMPDSCYVKLTFTKPEYQKILSQAKGMPMATFLKGRINCPEIDSQLIKRTVWTIMREKIKDVVRFENGFKMNYDDLANWIFLILQVPYFKVISW